MLSRRSRASRADSTANVHKSWARFKAGQVACMGQGLECCPIPRGRASRGTAQTSRIRTRLADKLSALQNLLPVGVRACERLLSAARVLGRWVRRTAAAEYQTDALPPLVRAPLLASSRASVRRSSRLPGKGAQRRPIFCWFCWFCWFVLFCPVLFLQRMKTTSKSPGRQGLSPKAQTRSRGLHGAAICSYICSVLRR